ncbi:cysteine-rich and transmembrane domain-containing protein 1-like [Hippoglossus stenolepis]|uniref:cysteine-rich and transmembrane domain-containing protein 1-like n=1 Tax=Hippoglossus stenolepis TaxID=195615 RepID=UPI001FAFBC12|nr:cysteine-rich and transmembrane domain-containing protein 1-like [Hippoglossus stenolepis]
MGPFITQPGHPGYWSGPPQGRGAWGGPKPYGALPKHTVYVVEQQDHHGGEDSCLRACSTALCCCCLWNMLTSHLG